MSKETLTWFGIPIIMGIGFLLFQIAMDLPTEETTSMLVGLVILAVLVAIGFAAYKAFDTARQHLTKPTPPLRRPPPDVGSPRPAIEPPPAEVSASSVSPDNAPEPTMTAQNQPSRSNADERASNKSSIPPKLAIFAAGTLFGLFLFSLLQPLSPSLPTFNLTSPRQQQKNTAERLSVPVELENSIGMRFALIPAGKFIMGASRLDNQATKDERPIHRVKISKPFYIGVYEVTQWQYEQVMGENPSEFQGNPRLPVHQVSWHEAVLFCARLTILSQERSAGRVYRLPTEAEWEYACRAGTRTVFHFGNSPNALDDYAWYKENSDGTPSPIGRKKPNRWGLYDMHGNVAEWCSDWYESKYYSISLTTDPRGPEKTHGYRVYRGGSYGCRFPECRSSFRRGLSPEKPEPSALTRLAGRNRIGFRVVMTSATLSQ